MNLKHAWCRQHWIQCYLHHTQTPPVFLSIEFTFAISLPSIQPSRCTRSSSMATLTTSTSSVSCQDHKLILSICNISLVQILTMALQWHRPVVSRIWSIKRRHIQRPWTTLTPDFRVKPLFDAEYLWKGTRYRHSFNGILIEIYIRPTQGCHFE